MRLYRIRPRDLPSACWVGTQKEAKNLAREYGHGAQWAAVEVPTDKEGLLTFLNEVGAAASRSELVDLHNFQARETVEELQRGDVSLVSPDAEARPGVATAAAAVNAEMVCDVIGTSRGATFGHILEATLTRLGDLAQEGWDQLSSILASPCYVAGEKTGGDGQHKIQRGLRFLALAQIREMDREAGQ
ncbi:MAG: hypothetical protein ACXW27_08680 [Allosphingosinicella sp.]